MGKRQFDRMKHSGRKNKSYERREGNKGWGNAMTDYEQSYNEEWGTEEEVHEHNVVIDTKDEYFKPDQPQQPVAITEQIIARMLIDEGPFKKDECIACFEYTCEEGVFNFHFRKEEREFWMLATAEEAVFVWFDPDTQKVTAAPKLRVIPIRKTQVRRKQPVGQPPSRQRPQRPQKPAAADWTVEQVKSWVVSLGEVFKSMADEFESYQIDGSVLMEVSSSDLQATFGAGLKTRKLFVEVKKVTGRSM